MSTASKFLEKKFLKSLEPLNRLTTDKLDEIISKSTVENLPAGRMLFRQGERDNNVLYLLSGQLELYKAGSTRAEIIKAKSSETQFPLINQIPRPCSAKTKTASSVLYIDSSLLEILLDDNPSGEYEVTEISMADESTDWMMKFLQSRAFLSMPTDNIQNLLMQMEEIPVKAGQTIIKQGEPGDYYYVINQGQCAVSRRPAPSAEDVRLAEIGIGSGFGEEALITGGKRNATLTMLTDGILMRLSKSDFLSILVEPLLQTIDIQKVIHNKKPSAVIIDVRSKKEFGEKTLPGAISIPLSMLRLRIPSLDPNREYLSYSDNGKDSSAAAFLLNQHGIACQIIEGSLASLESQPVKGKKDKQATAAKLAAQQKITSPQKKTSAQNQAPDNVRRLQETANKIHQQADQLVSKTDHHEDAQPSKAADTAKPSKTAAKPVTKSVKKSVAVKSAPVNQPDIHIAIPDPMQIARKESEKILAEANKIKQSALKEASRLRQAISNKASTLEAKETARLKQQLEETRHKAEAEIRKNEQLSEQMRMQAEQEREQILLQAREEAEQLKAEIQELRDKADQEQLEIKQQIESELNETRQQAREEARRQAEKETEQESRQIIKQARQEAEQLMSEIQALRAKAEQEQEEIKLQIEHEINAVKTRAAEEARLLAEKEAQQESKQIIEQAHHEAERLKTEIQILKDKAEQEQLEIQNKIEQEISTVKQRAAEEARLLAEKEASEIRKNARDEAKQINEALQHTKKLLEKKVNESQVETTISHNNVFDMEEQVAATPPPVPARKYEADEDAAKQMAIEIKKRLTESEQKRKAEEAGHKRAKSTVRKLKDRTILETETDIFVFKYPSDKDKKTQSSKPQQTSTFEAAKDAQHKNTTVSSSVETRERPEAETLDATHPEQTNVREAKPFDLIINQNHETERYAYQERKKKSFVAVAASFLLIIALSTVAYTTKIQLNFTEVSAIGEPKVPIAPDTIEGVERKVRHEAEKEFKRKLAKTR